MASKTLQLKKQGFVPASPLTEHIEAKAGKRDTPKVNHCTPIIVIENGSFARIGVKFIANGDIFVCEKRGMNQKWPEII